VVRPAPLQDEVWLVQLDPTYEAEMKKPRPCLVVSPNDMNENLRTVVIAPMTAKVRPFLSRVQVRFRGKSGQIALDQIKTVDSQRLQRKLGKVSAATGEAASKILIQMFSRS